MESPFEHIKHKIMNAQIHQYPYPHISINEIFPPEFYEEILENIPETSLYTPKPKYPGRKTKTLDDLEKLEKSKQKFWNDIIQLLRSEEFANILLEKFSVSKKGHSDLFIHKDLDDYEVTPHRDIRSKLITYLFYLAENSNGKNLGTYLLVPNNGQEIEETTKHLPWDQFKIVKEIEYLPNTFFAFTPNKCSFHAVKAKFPKDAIKKERDTIRGFVFDREEKDFPGYLFKNSSM